MARKTPISITIDVDLLERIDALAEKRGESRSEAIARLCRNDLAESESFSQDMESPLMRGLYRLVSSTPVLELMLSVAQDDPNMPGVEEIREGLKEQMDLGKERQRRKKGGKQQPGTA